MQKSSRNKFFNFKSSIKLILLVAFLFAKSNFSLAQKDAKFTVRFKLTIEKGDLKNALITITKNGAPFKVIDPNGGKYSVDLDLGANYLATCTKMGYISKSIILDTHIPSGREADDFAKFTATVVLSPQPEDQIVTYSQPVGKIKYSMDLLDFDYDKDYTQTALQMQKKDEEHPVPAPKPPKPNPHPVSPPPPPPPPVAKSKPIPIVVEQPKITHEVEKPKPVVVVPPTPQHKIVRTVDRKEIQEDRKKITIVTVTIDGTEFIYKKEEYKWGAVYFYKGPVFITERTFEKETEN